MNERQAKPYDDIPGTTIFDADMAQKGYHLNQFCNVADESGKPGSL